MIIIHYKIEFKISSNYLTYISNYSIYKIISSILINIKQILVDFLIIYFKALLSFLKIHI